MNEFDPQAQERIQIAVENQEEAIIEDKEKNEEASEDLLEDQEKNEENEVLVESKGLRPSPNPCCCPNIVRLFVFAFNVDICTTACPEIANFSD